jgi:hypothetical protein
VIVAQAVPSLTDLVLDQAVHTFVTVVLPIVLVIAMTIWAYAMIRRLLMPSKDAYYEPAHRLTAAERRRRDLQESIERLERDLGL